MLTQARLKQALHYDPSTGAFTWVERGCGRKLNAEAGSQTQGYLKICLDGTAYGAHRLAWLYMTGDLPSLHIDHRNGDRADNRWENLREATKQQNGQNRALSSHNTSGLAGVSWHGKCQKWAAHIHHDRRKVHLGVFESADDAYRAHLAAKSRLHTFQPQPRYEAISA